MDSGFLAYSEEDEEEEESFCLCPSLQSCLPPPCSTTTGEDSSSSESSDCNPCCCCISMSSESTEKDHKKPHFARIQYRPLIDSNILTGNTLLGSTQGAFYFPQTHQTLWPEHGAHYRPIKASPVITEQPFGIEKVRRSTRILAALRGRRRATTISTSKCKYFHDPTSPLPSLAQSSIEDPNQPTLTFSAIHDIQTSILTVFLKFASNLNHLMETPKKQNVHFFVTLHILPSKNEILQTCAKPSTESTNNPVFNQEFMFDGVPVGEVAEQTVVFRVYHGRALIGISKVPLNSIDLLGFTICKHITKIAECSDVEARNSAGDIQIALTYLPDSEVIEGVVLRVTNLRQHLISMHPPRPYVNIYLTYDGKRYAKWKSTVHYDTAVPVFNETFQFNVSKMDLNLVMLCVHVKEYHRTHLNNLLGVVEIGSTAQGAGRIHWQEGMNSPGQQISHWHSVVPLEGHHVHPAATSPITTTFRTTHT